MASLDLLFFGTPRILLDKQPITFDTRKAIALLAYLSFSPDGFTRDALAGFLWADYDQEHARAALRRTLSTIHSAIDTPETRWIETERDQVRLCRCPELRSDVEQFHQLLGACQGHPHAALETCDKCLDRLTKAVALRRGDFLAGFNLRDCPEFDDWQSLQNEILRRELSTALSQLAQSQSAQGLIELAVATARRWLDLDNLNEEAHCLLMRLYDGSGQRSAAIRQYRDCVRILDRELGVEPLEETQQLYRMIVENKLPPIKPVQAPIPQTLAVPPQPQPKPGAQIPLIGRARELRQIQEAYKSVRTGGTLVVLQGEPGIGKTRLAQEFLDGSVSQGSPVLIGRCYEGQTLLAFAPYIDALRSCLGQPGVEAKLRRIHPHWLAEGARLLPELRALIPNLPQPANLDGPAAQSLFFEGLRHLIIGLGSGEVPGILFLDDLQWADPASLDLTAFLVRRLPDFPILILATRRSDTPDTAPLLDKVLAETQRSNRLHLISLDRFTREEVSELVQAAVHSKTLQRGEVDRRLFAETEGLPLMLVEYLAAFSRQDEDLQGEWSVPATVRELFRARLAGIDEMAWQALTAAAVIGRAFDFDLLIKASGRSETEMINSLEQLARNGLIHERSFTPGEVPGFDFSHEKLRTYVYGETSLVRRRLLHRRVAEALASSGHQAAAAQAGQIAYHYQLAGADDLAARFYRQAGEAAQRLYANTQALEHYQAALALGYPDPAEIHDGMGDLYTLQAEYNQAVSRYQAASAECEPGCLPRIEHKLGNVFDRQGDWDQAEASFQSAVSAWEGDGYQEEKAHLLADWSRLAYHRLEFDRASLLAEQALGLANMIGLPRAAAQANNVLAMVARQRGELSTAAYHIEQSLALAEQEGLVDARIAALNNLALIYKDCEDYDQAIPAAQKALALCQQIGDRHRQAALKNNLADLFHAAGQPETALEHLKQAVVIFSEIGSESGELSPQPWKLVDW